MLRTTLLVILLATGVARAEVFEIPLPGLAGDYESLKTRGSVDDQSRTVSFDLGVAVARVNSAHVRWSGAVEAGWGRDGDSYFRWQGSLIVYLDSWSLTAWRAGVTAEAPEWGMEFSGEQTLESLGDSSWDFLADGRGEISVVALHVLYIIGEMVVPVTGRVDDLVLVLDVETAPLPVAQSTWGRIKALYR